MNASSLSARTVALIS